MLNEISKLLDDYVVWLKDKTQIKQINGWVEITTPHLDRHNDYIQIYASKNNGGFILTDDGYTIEDLKMSGCDLQSPKRKSLLEMTLNGFGVKLNNSALEVHTNSSDFPIKKHNLVQAMLAVNDLFYLSVPIVENLFLEDVTAWFDENDVRYGSKIKLAGKSGFDYYFDFLIPKSKQKPERLVQTINRPSRQSAEHAVMAWLDTKDNRPIDSLAYAIVNDIDEVPKATFMDALQSYDVQPIFWSQRSNFVSELVM